MREPEGVRKASELLRLFREYSALGGEGCQNPEALEQMESLAAGLNEDDLISHEAAGRVHISESNRRLPGPRRSDIPRRDALSCLTRQGYDGSVILESFVLSCSPAVNAFRG